MSSGSSSGQASLISDRLLPDLQEDWSHGHASVFIVIDDFVFGPICVVNRLYKEGQGNFPELEFFAIARGLSQGFVIVPLIGKGFDFTQKSLPNCQQA